MTGNVFSHLTSVLDLTLVQIVAEGGGGMVTKLLAHWTMAWVVWFQALTKVNALLCVQTLYSHNVTKGRV